MRVKFEASFLRDLQRIRNRRLLQRVHRLIEEIKAAPGVGQVRGVKKMQGTDNLYRVRLGDYRVGIEVVAGEVIFVRILHRKDIYRYFPR